MAFEVFQAGFLLLTALVFLSYSLKGQPWAAGITGLLLAVMGYQLMISGFQYPVGFVQQNNETTTYGNFTSNASSFSNLGIFQSSVITNKNLPVYKNQSSVNSIQYNSSKDNFTNFLGLFFLILGIILIVFSIILSMAEYDKQKALEENPNNQADSG